MHSVESIWLKLSQRIRVFVISKVSDRHVAEDIVQEVFVKAHMHIQNLRDETRLTSWIYQIARNLISDHYRRTGKTDVLRDVFPSQEEQNNESDVMQVAIRDMISMMDQLPPGYCDALCRTELEGMSQSEYAEHAGIPYSTAKSRIQRSRVLLRDMLMKCCHYQFDKYGTVLSIDPWVCCCCHPKK